MSGSAVSPVESAGRAADEWSAPSAPNAPLPLLLPGTVEPSGSRLAAANLEEVRQAIAPRTPPRPPAPPAVSPLEAVEATRRYVRGRAAAAEGKLLVAANELRRAVEEDPSSAAILEELGRTLGRLGDAAGAAECHERLLVLRPRDAEALFSSGVAAASRGDLPRAIERLATLASLPEADRGRGLAGFRPEAGTLAKLALGRALATIGADRATVEVLEAAAEEAPADLLPAMRGDLELSLGDALARTGDLAGAATAWERAAKVPGAAELALPRRMWAAVRLGRDAAAVEALAVRVREAGPDDETVALARWLVRVAPREAERFGQAVDDRRLAAALRGGEAGRRLLAEAIAADPAGASAELLRERFATLEPGAAIDEALAFVAAHPSQADACAAALVRSGSTAGGLLAAIDRVGERPGRAVLEPALAAALGDEARVADARPGSAAAAAREALLQSGRVAEALERAAIRASAAPTDVEAFRFTVAGVPRTGQGERLGPWLLDRQLRMPAEPESLEALVAFLLASGAEEQAFEILRRRAEAEPPEPFAATLLERALVERGRAREAFARARSRREAGVAPSGVREDLRFAALALEAGEPAVAAETLSRLADGRGPLDPGAALAAARLAERLPAEIAERDAIVTGLALSAARETAPERLPAALVVARLAARRFGQAGSEAERDRLAEAVALALAAAGSEARDLAWPEPTVDAFLETAQRLVDDEDLLAAAAFLATVVRDAPTLPAPVAGRLAVAACAIHAVAGERWERSLELLRLVRTRGARPFSREGDPAESEAEAIHRLSGLHSFLDDRIGADRLLERALALEPDHAMSLNNLAYSAVDRGEIDAVTVRRAERAHELAPDDPSVLDTLGWLRYKQGRFRDDASGPGAVTLISRSLRARPDDPGLEPLDHLGDALWRAGDREAAIRAWTAAAELVPVRYPLESIVAGLPEYERREQGVRLVDARDFWNRSYGEIGERAARKAATARDGGEPAVAPLAISGS